MAFTDTASWDRNLQELRAECHCNAQTYHECIEALLNHYRKTRDNDKYKRLKIEAFERKYARPAMKKFLLGAGWSVDGGYMVYSGDQALFRQVVNRLCDERQPPNPADWDPSTKIENVNYNGWNDPAEQSKRQAAAIERDRELEQYLKDKCERDAIAKVVIQNIKADQKYRKTMNQFGTPSPPNETNQMAIEARK